MQESTSAPLRFPGSMYISSVPCEIVVGDYLISVSTVPVEPNRHCSSLILDFPEESQAVFPCPLAHGHYPYSNSPSLLKDLLFERLTPRFSALGLPQDCVDDLVEEISRVAVCVAGRNHRPSPGRLRTLDVPYVSVRLSLETALKGATEESIQALGVLGAAELDHNDSCAIFFENLEAEVARGMRRMPCAHVFHTDCIAEWLRSSHMCPLCRFEMPVMEASSST